MAKKYTELNNRALGLSFASIGFIAWIIGLGWHGMMGQPTMMGTVYRGFSYLNPMHFVAVLIVLVVGGYVLGELVARFYNWFLKNKI